MALERVKDPLRVIHCHGCGVGLVVQFSFDCPRCEHTNYAVQIIGTDYVCRCCGQEVDELTVSADSELRRDS